MIGMLVSVLVDRYQRVFTRQLYVEDETIDFGDYSGDELNDTDTRSMNESQGRRRTLSKEIEDPDARARANAEYEHDENEIGDTLNVPTNLEPSDMREHRISRDSNRVHFIIGYIDDQTQEISKELLNSINTLVAQKQLSGNNIQLNIIADDQQIIAPITEIRIEPEQKENVFKIFQYP